MTSDGGFLIPKEYVEILDWMVAGGKVETHWFPLTPENNNRRDRAWFLFGINRFLSRIIWRLSAYHWRSGNVIPVKWMQWEAAYTTSWIDKDGVIQKKFTGVSNESPYAEINRRPLLKFVNDVEVDRASKNYE